MGSGSVFFIFFKGYLYPHFLDVFDTGTNRIRIFKKKIVLRVLTESLEFGPPFEWILISWLSDYYLPQLDYRAGPVWCDPTPTVPTPCPPGTASVPLLPPAAPGSRPPTLAAARNRTETFCLHTPAISGRVGAIVFRQSGWDLAERLERLTANAGVATVPGFDPSILGHSQIWRVADEALMNKVLEKSEKSLFKIKVFRQCFIADP